MSNRLDKFWAPHLGMKGSEYYSDDFMKFISTCFQDNAALRMTIPEIKASAWYKGSIAT